MSVSRRGFLGLAVGGIALAGVTRYALSSVEGQAGQTARLLPSRLPLPEPFQVPLPIPPVKEPTSTGGDTDSYDIVQQVASVEILPGHRTEIFGYDGIFPGPTIVSRSGRRTIVTHHNELPVPVSVHLHGGHVPADSDGHPIDLILPTSDWTPGLGHDGRQMPLRDTTVGSREHTYPMNQRAATLWYHDHRMDFTGPQVYRGLAGFHLIHDDEEEGLALPPRERDIPLLICDRSFGADGSFRYPAVDRTMQSEPGVLPAFMEGVLGDVILVNGAPWPELEVQRARYRFRILNACNARRLRLELDPGGDLVQIGSDHGLLAEPERHNRLDAAPAERFDVIVDFSEYEPGTTVELTNGLGSGGTGRVMRFRVTGGAVEDDPPIPERLTEIEELDPARAVGTRTWAITRGQIGTRGAIGGHEGWVINGESFDPERIDARPRLGDLEIWKFVSDVHHPMHIHLDPFQVVSRGTRPRGGSDHGWKDTVDLRPGEVVEVAIRFTDFEGDYMLHCHNLEHEDMAMMSAFETTT